jgi:secreted PhoX family phosphatase
MRTRLSGVRFPRRKLLRGGGALASLWVAGQPATARATETGRTLLRDPKGIVDLPPGFSYRILSRRGERMSDGYRVPGNPDAMGVFSVGDALVLMRNHEIMPGDAAGGPYPPGSLPPRAAYDPDAYGGVSRLVLDPRTLAVRSTNLALCGTHWNCAGGLSPWGWLSCEEIFVAGHGYVFLCSAESATLLPARPITAYGRYRHEAASVDPRTRIAYLTEDREDAAFYRFVPDHPTEPFQGRLQALRIVGQPGFDANLMTVGQSHLIDWVDIPEPDPAEDTVRYQAQERGALRFARPEGLWLSDSEAYFCVTAGGPIGRGQIFRLRHTGGAGMHLTLLVQTTDAEVLDMPDNITVAPDGQLYIAEDGLAGNLIRRITPAGQVVDFARNAVSLSEFAGPCFSPDGSTLFVNLQRDGLTLAIRGPFAAEAAAGAEGALTRYALPTPPGVAGIGAGLLVLALAALARRKRAQS